MNPNDLFLNSPTLLRTTVWLYVLAAIALPILLLAGLVLIFRADGALRSKIGHALIVVLGIGTMLTLLIATLQAVLVGPA